jgi:hypothetical protein
MLYARGNFKNVTIDLAIHSHSAPIYRLQCISIAREKTTHDNCADFFFTFL